MCFIPSHHQLLFGTMQGGGGGPAGESACGPTNWDVNNGYGTNYQSVWDSSLNDGNGAFRKNNVNGYGIVLVPIFLADEDVVTEITFRLFSGFAADALPGALPGAAGIQLLDRNGYNMFNISNIGWTAYEEEILYTINPGYRYDLNAGTGDVYYWSQIGYVEILLGNGLNNDHLYMPEVRCVNYVLEEF